MGHHREHPGSRVTDTGVPAWRDRGIGVRSRRLEKAQGTGHCLCRKKSAWHNRPRGQLETLPTRPQHTTAGRVASNAARREGSPSRNRAERLHDRHSRHGRNERSLVQGDLAHRGRRRPTTTFIACRTCPRTPTRIIQQSSVGMTVDGNPMLRMSARPRHRSVGARNPAE
jgi:hypothetical protein